MANQRSQSRNEPHGRYNDPQNNRGLDLQYPHFRRFFIKHLNEPFLSVRNSLKLEIYHRIQDFLLIKSDYFESIGTDDTK